jgi:hypothetical protein
MTDPQTIPGVTVLDAPSTAAPATNGTTPPVKKGSGKSKAELGVPEDWSIAWPPIAMPPEQHKRLTAVARYRDSIKAEGAKRYSIDSLLLDFVNEAVAANSALLDEQAAKAPAIGTTSKAPKVIDFTKLTPEQAEAEVKKQVDAAQKKYNDAQALLARMREAAAAGAIGTAIPEPDETEGEGDEGDEE